jgi:hypothetical protein
VLLYVDSTNKILGFNPQRVEFKPIPAKQPFNVPPEALQYLDNMRGPTRTLNTDYFFLNKARILELYNDGTITPEQYSSVLLITSAATGGMYWDELPDTYETLALSGLGSWESEP